MRVSPHAALPDSGTLQYVLMPRWKVYLKVWACGTPFVLCLDRKYRPVEAAELRRLATAFPPWQYVPEFKDCDDAAHAFRAFAGHGVGIALSRTHAWNVAVCTDGVWHIEPQTGVLTRKKRALAIIL